MNHMLARADRGFPKGKDCCKIGGSWTGRPRLSTRTKNDHGPRRREPLHDHEQREADSTTTDNARTPRGASSHVLTARVALDGHDVLEHDDDHEHSQLPSPPGSPSSRAARPTRPAAPARLIGRGPLHLPRGPKKSGSEMGGWMKNGRAISPNEKTLTSGT